MPYLILLKNIFYSIIKHTDVRLQLFPIIINLKIIINNQEELFQHTFYLSKQSAFRQFSDELYSSSTSPNLRYGANLGPTWSISCPEKHILIHVYRSSNVHQMVKLRFIQRLIFQNLTHTVFCNLLFHSNSNFSLTQCVIHLSNPHQILHEINNKQLPQRNKKTLQ